jgi:hypothetical protein
MVYMICAIWTEDIGPSILRQKLMTNLNSMYDAWNGDVKTFWYL